VLSSAPVAPVTSSLECAKRTDGAAAVVIASSSHLASIGRSEDEGVAIIGGGEGSGPLHPPDTISEDMFSAEEAVQRAYRQAQVRVPNEIDFFGLYDCFPICFIRSLEAVGLAPKGKGGAWVEERYSILTAAANKKEDNDSTLLQRTFPINTHGGLQGFGAPWAVPSLFSVVEAVEQLSGRAGVRQIEGAKTALVYGNGGIFSSSAVAILRK